MAAVSDATAFGVQARVTARAPVRPVGIAAARAWAALALLVFAVPAVAGEIHRCPQPDGTTRFQDRPCAATPAPPAAPASSAVTEPPSRVVAPSPRPPTRSVPPLPSEPPESARISPESRAGYIARNADRCRDGDRRACAAVTCERSGRLDSPACQEAVGYLRGAGWDLRPRSDLFDPDRASDEFTLTCRDTGRRTTLTRARGAESYSWPASAGATAGAPASTAVPRAALPDAVREFCGAR
jgi:hypothetical protein